MRSLTIQHLFVSTYCVPGMFVSRLVVNKTKSLSSGFCGEHTLEQVDKCHLLEIRCFIFTFFFFCLSLIVFKIYCLKLFIGAVMQENLRFASSGDDIKIWDASSMTLVDKFNPHTSPHGISSMCWSSNSILFVFLNNHFC